MSRWRPPGPPSSPYITRAGYTRLEVELGELWGRRTDVVRHLAAAAAEGDRSENAEYIYRKRELAQIDRRIHYLQRRMPSLRVVDAPLERPERVYFGAWVELIDQDGCALRVRIVGSDELEPERNWISVDSPLARALLGRVEDDEVRIRTDAGLVEYVVTGVSYGPQ
ncbi:MAG: transcription elongation factor GreB [Gammaproteobacteria bacterium]